MVSRRSPAGATERASRASRPDAQFDLWPQRIVVEPLDARAVAGAQTRVLAMYRVRYEREPGVHQVFHDQHGWYCAEHGPACKAVREVTERGVVPPTD